MRLKHSNISSSSHFDENEKAFQVISLGLEPKVHI